MAALLPDHVAFRRPAAIAATLLVAVLASLGITGCGSDEEPGRRAARTQAIERLEGFGLSEPQAACIVDEVGAATVVEATDINAFSEGQEYRDAASECIADG